MKEQAIIGIDAGTTNIKVIAFRVDGCIIRRIIKPVTLIIEERGFAEIDLMQYWKSIVAAIKELIAATDIDILSIGISSTCPTTILFDENLQPLGHGIVYMDNRACRYVEKYIYSLGLDRKSYEAEMGNQASVAACSISNLMWLKDNEPQKWQKAVSAGMLNSFIASRFSGNIGVDWTQASYSGVFRLETSDNTWNASLLSAAGIEESIMPEVVSPYKRIGVVTAASAQETGLRQGIPVAVGAADTACASFALGLSTSDVFESVGTSGVMTFVQDKPEFDPVFMNRKHIIDGLWLAHGANSFMGGSLDWLLNSIFTDYKSIEEMNDALVDAAPGANNIAFLPYLSGERSPIWDSSAVGVWYGMTSQTTRIDMIQAVYESGAYVLKQLLNHAEKSYGIKVRKILAVGNGTRSRHWMQIRASVLNTPYMLTSFADAAALGAAMLGGIAAKVYSDPLDCRLPRLQAAEGSIEPENMAIREKYQKTFEVYDSLYPALKDIMHRT